MRPITFTKMNGCGNDFVVIDNRDQQFPFDPATFARLVCRRRLSVGADGLILIENSSEADFCWQFYNSDGSRAEMCGNGARCASRYAYLNHIAGAELSFVTDAGVIEATIRGDGVRLKMTPPSDLRQNIVVDLEEYEIAVDFINTGVPHTVVACDDLEHADVAEQGRAIRYHQQFVPQGTNVNFYSVLKEGQAALRTYERGVEAETMACGTGAVASALILSQKLDWPSPIMIQTTGGRLTIYFSRDDGRFCEIYMEGDAKIVYTAQLGQEALVESGNRSI